MSVVKLALQQEYIGRFVVTDTDINWFPEHSWSWYRDFGDDYIPSNLSETTYENWNS